jgi:hypothetical protein
MAEGTIDDETTSDLGIEGHTPGDFVAGSVGRRPVFAG